MVRQRTRTPALILLATLVGSPGVGIACWIDCQLTGHHAEHAHEAAPAGMHHHDGSATGAVVGGHHACDHLTTSLEATVRTSERIVPGNTTASPALDPAPRDGVAGTRTTISRPPTASRSSLALVRATVLRL